MDEIGQTNLWLRECDGGAISPGRGERFVAFGISFIQKAVSRIAPK